MWAVPTCTKKGDLLVRTYQWFTSTTKNIYLTYSIPHRIYIRIYNTYARTRVCTNVLNPATLDSPTGLRRSTYCLSGQSLATPSYPEHTSLRRRTFVSTRMHGMLGSKHPLDTETPTMMRIISRSDSPVKPPHRPFDDDTTPGSLSKLNTEETPRGPCAPMSESSGGPVQKQTS